MKTFTKLVARLANRLHVLRFSHIISILVLLVGGKMQAQKNPLNRKISLEVSDQRLDDALDEVAAAGKFSFSYNSDLLKIDSLVSYQARNTVVRDATVALLGPSYACKALGNHVVIRLVNLEPPLAETPKLRTIDGFLIDAKTGKPVSFGTIFEDGGQTTTLTSAAGSFHVDVSGNLRQLAFSFHRMGYRDTVVVFDPWKVQHLTVGIMPHEEGLDLMSQREANLIGDSFQEKLPFEDFLVPEAQRNIARNLTESLRNFPIQVSFLPAISTNRFLGGGADVNFSLNIFAGYSYGVNGVEIGGLVNIDRGNVRGFQVGGLTNVVGGDVLGFQVAGLANYVKGEVNGLQVAGLFNRSPKAVKGLQIAGLFNQVPDDISHVQIGGLFNMGHNIGGFQIGGLGNLAKGNVGGFQIGGLHNQANGDVKAFQIAGISNIAKGNVDGFQIGGIYNQAKIVNGFQIGLVNKADSVAGFQIGLINLVERGYKALVMSSNDIFQTNIGYKAGRKEFYNILNFGYRFGPKHQAFSYGAGFGTSHSLGVLNLSLEATCNQMLEESLPIGRLNMLIPMRLHLGLPIGEKLEMFAGASLNLQISNAQSEAGEFKTVLGSRPIWRNEGRNTLTQSWMGYNVGINIGL